ncbi:MULTISPECIES: competence type IV pilus minor pilin ComGD [Bacillaceae]|uniref:competence type IV pilus minor pilin ComGD n=1 Tax=Bacillaceae TaxID=186817 RepID=UPI000A2AB24B|nr:MULTISPECIES: competence type IV pilus minor pilin ComGD [unclassified Bacillus (in: firmicutes)]PGY13842.1 competence protein ComG [Bacillus sp. AFS031507]SMQ82840.1 competence protein ComGD [Bacillus sp. OV166]
MNTHQKGFTLIESLLVLSIFMIISSITVFSLKPQHSVMEDEAFLIQLKADLYYAQQYAISHHDEVSIVFVPDQYRYFLYLWPEPTPIVNRNYSTNIYLKEGSLPLYLKFLSDGNVNQFGNFFIQTKNKTYVITFLIGEGRFYVKEY